MKKDKKIQALFKSQEIRPFQFLHNGLETVFNLGRSRYVREHGLFKMFDTSREKLQPIVATFDFSDGKVTDTHLIGKGVLFDTGGYSLKTPSKYMETMHNDRFGALNALVIGRELGLPVTIFLVVNTINDYSVFPGTVMETVKGKKVRIVNTDAEGRIGLAQAIEDLPKPKHLITFATLTGASAYAVGEGHAEMFTHDVKKAVELVKMKSDRLGIGRLFSKHKDGLYTNGAINNATHRQDAQSAYLFLNEFLRKGQQLTHFDIAGFEGDQYKDYTYGMDDMIKIIKKII